MRLFRNIAKEMEFIDRELELYKKEQKLAADEFLNSYRVKIKEEIHNLKVSVATDTAKFEHEYHHGMEIKKSQLAGLTARLESMTELISCRKEIAMSDENLIQSQKAEISRLTTIIDSLIKNQPKTTIQNLTHGH